jgi:hypothetical protein
MKEVEMVEPDEMSEMEALATLFEGSTVAVKLENPEPQPQPQQQDSPLVLMALAGRVEEVKFLLACAPDSAGLRDAQGRTPLQRMRMIPSSQRTPEQQQVIELLVLNQ